MLFEGDSSVFRHLFLKKFLMERGDAKHEEIRPALLILSGMMRGVYGGGQVTALEDFGLTEAFDAGVFGISTGAAIGAYFLARQSRLGTRIYSEELVQTDDFISGYRMLRGGYAVDTTFVARVFRGEVSNKRLDQESIYRSPIPFFVGLTSTRTGEGVFMDAKVVKPDVTAAILPSISYPGLSPEPYEVDGEFYCDGTGALPLPTSQVIEKSRPTDLLVLANCSPIRHLRSDGWLRILSPWLFKNCVPATRSTFLSRNKNTVKELELFRAQKPCRGVILWTDESIGKFERNPNKLREAALRSEKHLTCLLEEVRTGLIP